MPKKPMTPEQKTARKIFRILWRLMSWSNMYDNRLFFGCLRCTRNVLSAGEVRGYGACTECIRAAEKRKKEENKAVPGSNTDEITRDPMFDDIEKLQKLGFLQPLSSLDGTIESYKDLMKYKLP